MSIPMAMAAMDNVTARLAKRKKAIASKRCRVCCAICADIVCCPCWFRNSVRLAVLCNKSGWSRGNCWWSAGFEGRAWCCLLLYLCTLGKTVCWRWLSHRDKQRLPLRNEKCRLFFPNKGCFLPAYQEGVGSGSGTRIATSYLSLAGSPFFALAMAVGRTRIQ